MAKGHESEAAMAYRAEPEGCSVGSFKTQPLEKLVAVLKEKDAKAQQQQLRDLGVTDESFAPALARSSMLCQRGAALYPRSDEIAVSFNGGKDACVVLYLWLASLAAKAAEAGSDGPPQAIFFDSPDEFAEVRCFVKWVVETLGLKMVLVESKSFRLGMEDLVAGGLRAVVMGQRRGDPWMDKVDAFSPSDNNWPAFMRMNPIIDWNYSYIWVFLRTFGLPYCDLYDQGYTSLGSVASTKQNPSLLRPDGSFAPAYELSDWSMERAGRDSGKAENGKAKPERQTSEAAGYTSPTLRAFKSAASNPMPQTAGIAVLGNEILTGKVHDANAHFLCGQLHSLGVVVKSVEFVADDVDAIARCIKNLSSRCDFVFASGGLGPTHDDVTMAGIAEAFDVSLTENQRLFALLASKSGGSESSRGDRTLACKKMAQLPEGATVEWPEDGNPWPIVSMRNVFIFAGNPPVFRSMYERAAGDGRFKGARHWVSLTLWLDADEEDVLEALQRTVEYFPFVEIGSYPSTSAEAEANRRRRLSITFEAFDEEQVAAARRHLKEGLPAGILTLDDAA
mmetsp:Transcript_69634/g.123269  ORF Transcript_69634/g.123269 Transcript_69634/m.123269 type:complete len:564 (+) Transcript_69634:83-1774(+)|eukprot:CAMPEP_0197620710 /NCGR_PEP_ID=MMETSP1338-20131121/1490_1 /TAXON_ID=43686 ORGANISM="Pelagodinium beii, Strain RCC1491" /NCGR_SAMPLE_ID=MMETSP1338 /ASSEMBLY_ACC=CAM_ASM_000754 /LENGTH=563 /DNA_ID=CAMNT_0043189975 /DNA_START=70 /DNA_END=1764 /DNA_ORIENTATION=-